MTSPTAERILEVAERLFASQGYVETTVGQLEEAAGLTPRASGLYRHFASKQAILETIIDNHLAGVSIAVGTEPAPGWAADPEIVRAVADQVLADLDAQRHLTRILARDLESLPELFERTKTTLIRQTYSTFTSNTRDELHNADDPEATAAVLFAGLVSYGLYDALFGEAPGGIEPQRFAAAWADTVHRLATT